MRTGAWSDAWTLGTSNARNSSTAWWTKECAGERNAGTLDSGEVGIVIDANPPASRSSNLGRVEFKRKLRTKVFSLHDGDLIEISGVYVGEGWLSQPWIDGDTVQLVSDVALTSRADERRK